MNFGLSSSVMVAVVVTVVADHGGGMAMIVGFLLK